VQAAVHGEVIGELQDFAATFPDSPIRSWADRTVLKLKDRLKELDPDICANLRMPVNPSTISPGRVFD
jgi:hypothetical protein